MSILSEFKAFAMRGNVVDLAVGVVIGAAFGKIVSSAVDDLIMPPLGLLLGGVDFSELALTLKDAADGLPAVTLNYGRFVQTCVDFTIIAFAIFLLVKAVNRLQAAPPAAAPAPAPSAEATLLAEIRDLLRSAR